MGRDHNAEELIRAGIDAASVDRLIALNMMDDVRVYRRERADDSVPIKAIRPLLFAATPIAREIARQVTALEEKKVEATQEFNRQIRELLTTAQTLAKQPIEKLQSIPEGTPLEWAEGFAK